jgi:hypothetical protein
MVGIPAFAGMTVALAQKEGAAENAAAERLVCTDNPCAAAFSAAFGIRQCARHFDRREKSRIVNHKILNSQFFILNSI